MFVAPRTRQHGADQPRGERLCERSLRAFGAGPLLSVDGSGSSGTMRTGAKRRLLGVAVGLAALYAAEGGPMQAGHFGQVS